MPPLDLEQLKERANRALGSVDVSTLFTGYRAIVGAPADTMGDLARAALETLRDGGDPTAAQLQALEMAIRLQRPAPLVRHDEVDPLDTDGALAFPEWNQFRASVHPHIGAVGRIDRRGDPNYPFREVATGFSIGPDMLVTNRHVAVALSAGTTRIAPGQAVVRFGQEFGVTPDPPPVPIVDVAAIHDELDLALLRIEPSESPPTPFRVYSESVAIGDFVVTIGYPLPDSRNPLFIELLFGDRLGVKRAAPGEIVGTLDSSLFHDCSTLGGNSGSPVLAMEDASLVGVHADGFFLARNEAITGPSMIEFLRRGTES